MLEVIATGCFHSALPDGRSAFAAVRSAKAKGAVVVDAGDFFSGSAFHTFSQGRVEERLLSELYDAVVPGNHDLPDLMRLRDPDRFPPVVCANLRPPPAFAGRWVSGLMLERGAHRLGVVGYLGRQAFETIPAHERADFTYCDPTAELIGAEAARLREAGADIVIGVSHTGFLADVADQETGWPLPVVVASHCHSPWSHWTETGRHVAKPPAAGTGLLRMVLSPSGSHRVTQETCPPSASSGDGLEADLEAYEAWGQELLGTLEAPLADRRDVARRLADHARRILGAQTFVLNLYTLRSGLPQTVTRRDLMACAPFDSDLVVLDAPCPLDVLTARSHAVGEELLTATSDSAQGPSPVVTTGYVADRLGLPAHPVHPPRTLRDTLTDLVRSPHE
ncbi:bifunctional metallophosphatase/5'-nucleotidase [Streptomyces sp. GQFP]|uniref:bifunctional metallophosphatase/5'-nucleotidase n=1 Tax=Streptomyces sp. GQFP TaxID=2907545 RepID=UPI001F361BF9|nr:bifunctional metallophosphatase/5'-nucleotidase [Streptomyces sp. GQFP]UIX34279.1 bifunctional metallophosphatase/5'-nucleotidase [Streptomyces sp. GQFP]